MFWHIFLPSLHLSTLHGMLGLKFLGHFSWSLQTLLRFHVVGPIQGSEDAMSLFLHIYL